MKIKINQPILEKDGNTAKIIDKNEDLSLKFILGNAALATLPEMTKEQVTTDFQIFLKINSAKDEVDLKSEEITRLKEKLHLIPNTPVITRGQICDFLLEGKENPLKKQ